MNEFEEINLIASFWLKKNALLYRPSLKSLAKYFLENISERILSNEKYISLTPLQCQKIAEAYENYAMKLCRSTTQRDYTTVNLNSGLFDLYKSFIDVNISSGENPMKTWLFKQNRKRSWFKKLNSIKNWLFKQNPKVSSFKIIKPQLDPSIQYLQQITLFHYKVALETFFPQIGYDLFKEYLFLDLEFCSEVVTYLNLLEKTREENTLRFKFFNPRIAEFLVVEYIANELFSESMLLSIPKPNEGRSRISLPFNWTSKLDANKSKTTTIFPFLLQRMLQIQKQPFYTNSVNSNRLPKSHIFLFTFSTMVCFLDYRLNPLPQNLNENAIKYLNQPELSTQVCRIIESCAYHNYINIFKLIFQIFETCKGKYQISISKKKFAEILSVICLYSNVDFVIICIDFFDKFIFTVNLQEISDIFIMNKWDSPLQLACKRGSYDLVEYFLNKNISATKQCLIHRCVMYSDNDTKEDLKKRDDIITFLVGKNAELIYETDIFGSTPLLINKCNLVLIKLLIEQGACIFSTDKIGNTLIHYVASWMSPNQFHELTVFIVQERKAGSVYLMKNNKGETGFQVAQKYIDNLREDTVALIPGVTLPTVTLTNEPANSLHWLNFTHNLRPFTLLV